MENPCLPYEHGGICDLLYEMGNGTSIFIDTITSPLGLFLLFLAIIGSIIALLLGIVHFIRKIISK